MKLALSGNPLDAMSFKVSIWPKWVGYPNMCIYMSLATFLMEEIKIDVNSIELAGLTPNKLKNQPVITTTFSLFTCACRLRPAL